MTTEKSAFLAKWLGLGSFLISVLVTSQISIDPVNISKLLALGIIAFGLLPVITGSGILKVYGATKIGLITAVGMTFISSLTIIFSKLPLSQNLYGYFGRNTGYLAYVFLIICFSASTLVTSIKDIRFIWYSFFAVGIVNVIYCGIFLMGTDLISWSNPYGKILGTFGNPDFISAFLGMFATSILAFALGYRHRLIIFLPSLLIYFITFFEIRKSSAIQGTVVFGVGSAIVIFLYLKSITKNLIIQVSYVSIIGVLGLISLAGAFQKGPFAEFIYKSSISLRGVYWNAGIQMGKSNPFIGVGFDGYGDYYRQFRSAKAMVFPGTKTVSNAAHNVLIDIFASGGFLLLALYLGLIVLVTYSAFRIIRHFNDFNWLFSAIFSAWVGYQLQTIVSINQLGIAIWGWVFGGLIIAYERILTNEKIDGNSKLNSSGSKIEKKNSRKSNSSLLSKSLIGGVVGFLVVYPAFKADADWRLGLKTNDFKKLYEVAVRNPMDSTRTNKIAIEFERVGLSDQALDIILKGTKYNPRSYDSWWILFNLTKASDEQKKYAESMMRNLDPRNTNLE